MQRYSKQWAGNLPDGGRVGEVVEKKEHQHAGGAECVCGVVLQHISPQARAVHAGCRGGPESQPQQVSCRHGAVADHHVQSAAVGVAERTRL